MVTRPCAQKGHTPVETWLVEIAAMAISSASLAIIAVLLQQYNGYPQFRWHVLTLNAVISALATIVRIGFVVPVAASLAQWKWMWFSKRAKPLADFQTLNEADRGSVGSIMLIWRTRSWSLAAIGAWIMLLSAATEFFFQQVIVYEDTVQFRNSTNVQIPYATSWAAGSEFKTAPGGEYGATSNGTFTTLLVDAYYSVQDVRLDLSAQAAVLFGLSADASHVAEQLPALCATGNCTWPPYASLGVCAACSDVSDMVTHFPKVDLPLATSFFPLQPVDPYKLITYSLPNGLNIDNLNPSTYGNIRPLLMTARSTLRPSETLTFQSSTTMLFAISVMRVPSTEYPVEGHWATAETNVQATECGLYLCVKQFVSKFHNGKLVEVSKEIAASRDESSWQVAIYQGQDGIEYEPWINPSVDALFSNNTYFPRTDLQITVPHNISTTNDLNSVSVTQTAVDGLSSYLSSLFNDGSFDISPLPGWIVQDFAGACSTNGTTEPCGLARNVTGMVIGGQGDTNASKIALLYGPPVMRVLWDSPDLATTFTDLAQSITNAMRTSSEDQSTLSGQLGVTETVLRVRWAWITLPAFCVGLSLLFLLTSMWEAKKDETPLWKGNTLATLFHGLDPALRTRFEHATDQSEMGRAVDGVKVRLCKDADGVLLLRHEPTSCSEPEPAESDKMLPASED